MKNMAERDPFFVLLTNHTETLVANHLQTHKQVQLCNNGCPLTCNWFEVLSVACKKCEQR